MIDIKEILNQSVNIANYFDEICGLCSSIESKAKNNLFDKDKFSASVDEIRILKNNISSKMMITRELIKKYLRIINVSCISLNQYCNTITNKKHEKDSISPGGNHGVNISRIDTPDTFYYDITFPKNNNDQWKPESINIKPIKIEECGSIVSILTDNLTKLSSDIASIILLIPTVNNNFEKDIQNSFLPAISSLENLITAPSTIDSLINIGTSEDNSDNIINSIIDSTSMIFNRCQNYKNIINDLNNTMTAMNKNSEIINEALELYMSMDTLL